MESTKNVGSSAELSQNQIYCENLKHIYSAVKDQIEVLSLDCFDTLIWRHVSKPADVFYALQAHPEMASADFSTGRRMQGEGVARARQHLISGQNEINMLDIYQAAFPGVSTEKLNKMIRAEVEEEVKLCYTYTPVADLLKQAKLDGKRCIIVSDTYFSEEQLREILSKNLPGEVYACIDEVYVSNAAGISKSQGMLKSIATQTNTAMHKILHLGDNYSADFSKPVKDGAIAGLFRQQCQYIEEVNRMAELTAQLCLPAVRDSKPLYDEFKNVFANHLRDQDDDAKKIGYGVLGPIYYNFAQYLVHEYESIKQSAGDVKVAFMLRDAHLAYQACQALTGQKFGTEVRISRFTSYAASFRTKDDIVHYIAGVISGKRYSDIMKQLLLSDKSKEKINTALHKSNNKLETFRDEILQADIINEIVQNSKEYFQNFKKYLQDELALESGDTLMLVDLGYSCTTQMTLGKVIENEMGVNVVGRYLLSIRTLHDYRNRRGLIDQSWCHEQAMLAVVNYIALLEQLSTTTDKSVISFNANGKPVYSNQAFSDTQYTKMLAIQGACLEFIQDMNSEVNTFKFPDDYTREFTYTWLARFIFFPTQDEISYLGDLKFDLNLGTTDTFSIFNPEVGVELLRERGLFSIEKSTSLMRTNYPSELRYANIDLAIMLLTQHRYHYDFTLADSTLRHEVLEIIITNGVKSTMQKINARATFDGFFTADIPVGNGGFHLGILLGKQHKWLQVGSISLIDITGIYSDVESTKKTEIDNMQCDRVIDHKNGLLECTDQEALCLFAVPQTNNRSVLRFNYRPITGR